MFKLTMVPQPEWCGYSRIFTSVTSVAQQWPGPLEPQKKKLDSYSKNWKEEIRSCNPTTAEKSKTTNLIIFTHYIRIRFSRYCTKCTQKDFAPHHDHIVKCYLPPPNARNFYYCNNSKFKIHNHKSFPSSSRT